MKRTVILSGVLSLCIGAVAQAITVNINTDKPGLEVNTSPVITSSKYSDAIHCVPAANFYNFRQYNLVLNTHSSNGTQRYFLLRNTSNHAFWLNRVMTPSEVGASAGWDSQLNSGQQSIIALNRSNFSFACSRMQHNKLYTIDCRKVLDVCALQPPVRVNGKVAKSGNYWVKENF
jgi:hypothetical protein